MHPYILTWPWKRLLWLNNRENREVAAVNGMTLHKTTKCGKWSLLVLRVVTSCCKLLWTCMIVVLACKLIYCSTCTCMPWSYTCVQLLTPVQSQPLNHCSCPHQNPTTVIHYTHTRTCLTSSTSLAFIASAGVAYSGSILARVDTFCVRTTLWS